MKVLSEPSKICIWNSKIFDWLWNGLQILSGISRFCFYFYFNNGDFERRIKRVEDFLKKVEQLPVITQYFFTFSALVFA